MKNTPLPNLSDKQLNYELNSVVTLTQDDSECLNCGATYKQLPVTPRDEEEDVLLNTKATDEQNDISTSPRDGEDDVLLQTKATDEQNDLSTSPIDEEEDVLLHMKATDEQNDLSTSPIDEEEDVLLHMKATDEQNDLSTSPIDEEEDVLLHMKATDEQNDLSTSPIDEEEDVLLHMKATDEQNDLSTSPIDEEEDVLLHMKATDEQNDLSTSPIDEEEDVLLHMKATDEQNDLSTSPIDEEEDVLLQTKATDEQNDLSTSPIDEEEDVLLQTKATDEQNDLSTSPIDEEEDVLLHMKATDEQNDLSTSPIDEEEDVLLNTKATDEQNDLSPKRKPRSCVDRHWAWVILCGCFVNNMLMIGYLKSFGIMFVEFQEAFQTSASAITLVMGVQQAVFSTASILTLNILIEKISIRKLMITGSILASLGVSLSGFATCVEVLILSHGCMFGLGFALVNGPGTVLLTHYFEKHVRIAIAVANCSTSIGCMLLPPFITFLLDEYSRQGTMLLVSGVLMQMVVSSSLFRPLRKDGQVTRSRESNTAVCKQTSEQDSANDVKLSVQVSDVNTTYDVTLCSQVSDVNTTYDVTLSSQVSDVNTTFDVTLCSQVSEENMQLLGDHTNKTHRVGNSAQARCCTHCKLHEQAETSFEENLTINSNTQYSSLHLLNHSSTLLLTNPCCQNTKFNQWTKQKDQSKREHNCSRKTCSVFHRIQPNTTLSSSYLDNIVSYTESSFNRPQVHISSNIRTSGKYGPSTVLFISLPDLSQTQLSSQPHIQATGYTSDATPVGSNTKQTHNTGFTKLVFSKHSHNTIDDAPVVSNTKPNLLIRFLKRIDIALFTNPRFLIIFCFTSCGVVGYSMFGLFIPPLAEENGLMQVQATILLSVIAGCDLFSRLLSGVIAEMRWMKTHVLLGMVFLFLGVAYQFIRLYSSFELLMAFVVVFGCLGGSYSTLHPIIVLEFLGVDEFPKAFGFVQVFHGASQSINYPIIGTLRDVTGTYNMCFNYMGATLIIGAVSLFLELLLRGKPNNQKKKSKLVC